MGTFSLIAIGANLPFEGAPPEFTLRRAMVDLGEGAGLIRATSRFFSTPAFPAGAGPDYVNGAVAVETTLSETALLEVLHRIEQRFGRERVQRWGQRTLDLDLVAFGSRIHPDLATFEAWRDLPVEAQSSRAPTDLILPHPRLQDRGFVLVPLGDIAPSWVHPVSGETVSQMLAALPDAARREVVAL